LIGNDLKAELFGKTNKKAAVNDTAEKQVALEDCSIGSQKEIRLRLQERRKKK